MVNSPSLVVWDEVVEIRFKPRYFTREAWATLTHQQRETIRHQRMAVVEQLRADHEAHYHHGDRRADELAHELDARHYAE
jgi:hypothetical protein